MNIPQITSIDNTLKIFYTYSELSNKEIVSLFGKLSSATIAKIKKSVKEEMNKRNIFSYGLNKINTTIAFDVWGIDVSDLENRREKLKTLELQ